jgi:hypothetical protein
MIYSIGLNALQSEPSIGLFGGLQFWLLVWVVTKIASWLIRQQQWSRVGDSQALVPSQLSITVGNRPFVSGTIGRAHAL